MDDQVHTLDHEPVGGSRGPAVVLKERQSHSSRNNNTFKVAAPLPRSARHAVTLASLIGDEDEEEVEMDEMELAQAREAYSYSRAIMAHMAGQSGSTPPPAPSSGKGLGGSSAQLWSPSLSTTTFSNPSTSSLSSPSRPRSSSARNSFSSLTASSYDQDRSSWGTRPPSFGHSLKRIDALASLSSMTTGSASEETRPNARHNTSSLPSAAGPAVQSWSRLTLPQAVLTEATATISKPSGRHHKRSTTLPPAFVSQIDASASASGQKHLSLSGNDRQAPLIRSPSPIMTGPADASESGPYHWADTDSDLPISADAMRRKKKLVQSRSSSWQPDWPSLSRNATIRSAKPRNGAELRSQADAQPELGVGSFPRPRALVLNDADVVEPAMRSAPLDDGDRRMIEGLRLYEDESDNEVTSGRASGESSLHARRQSLGGRRKSVDFAVKAMGRWAKRKNSTGAFEMQHEPIRAWDRARRPKSHSLSGVMMNPMLGIAATFTPPPRLKSSLEEDDAGELVTALPFRTSSASGSPSRSPRQLSVSSVHRISRPMSSMPQLYYPDSPDADAQPLEELNRFSSRLTRIESLNALSGAFRKLSTTGEKRGEGEVSEPVQAPGTTHKRLFKAMRDHPLIKRLDSGIAGAVAPLPSEQRSPDRQVGKKFEYLTPIKASDDGRESVTPTQISASVGYRSSAQTGEAGGSTPLQSSTPDIDRKNGTTSAGPLALLVEEPARSGSPQASRMKHGERRSRSATQPDLSIGSIKGMFAKKSYAALVNAFNSTGPASTKHVPTVTASGSEIPHGGGDGLPYMSAPIQGAAGSGPSGGMGSGGGGGGGGNYGWGGLGGGMPGGDGGNGGRPPGGGGGTLHTGRSSPPIQSIFRRLELVGRGAYGAVYRGLHVSSGLHVALKVVNLDTPEDDVSDIQKEVSLLSQLRETTTKNVVKYWGCWLKGSELWIVMDFAEGGSVRTLMKAGPIAEKYAVVIVRESLVALSYLHKSGIIHRDIKAANILLRTTGKVLLCDFGVAASLVSSSVHSKRSTFVGTPYWMAPEVITQGKTYDQSADIWSLGITVYEMVTGNPPLSDQEQMRAIMLIPKSKPPRLPAEGDFSPLLREFVSLCLNEEPKERPSADELAKSKWIKSSSKVPHSMLRDLIQTYAAWTKSGGMRMSLIGAEASELNDVNNRESFAFDGIDSEEGWEFNTDNHSVEWPNGEHIPPSAPLRDHPLLRLFHDGGVEDTSTSPGPSQVQHQQHTQPLAARAASSNPAAMPQKGASNNAGPTPTYMGADVRPAPLPPGPIPERPPLAALTSAVDKGSFTGMGATPFRFGRSGAVVASMDEAMALPTSAPASSSNLHQEQHQTQLSNASAQASDENGGGEISMVSSAYGFHQNAGASSANTSMSTAFPSVEGARGNDSPQRPPDSATDSSHQRDGSGLSGVSSSANESQKALQGKDQRHKHTRNESSSHFSHSRERSEGTSISVGASQASEKRNATKTLLQQQAPLSALRNEGLQQNSQRGGNAPSSEAPSVPRPNQTVGSSLQRPAQLGARSRSGSRGRPQDGGMADVEWSNSSQQPPLPSRSAVVPSASSSLIRSGTPGSSTAVQRMQHQVGDTTATSPLHQRRQHGGSDPTQMLGRASRELSPKVDQAQVESNVAAGNLSLQHPSGAPSLRMLDLKALMEQEDVFTELEQTVLDLGAWLDVVGSGLAQVAARCV